jgi:predicted dehydrogenase
MTLRVGLLSTANINRLLLGGARAAEGVEVVAVASRDAERAESFAAEHGLGRAHGSYDALLADPDVDAVYVPLPNSMHVEWSIRALEAGKHVLCEKPLTRHPEQAEAAFDAAERAGRVLAEAFMWRHHPQAAKLRELVEGGAVGELRLIRTSFAFDLLGRGTPADVRLQEDLDGGGLMDVGCYCVSGMRFVAGEPERVSARQVSGGDGVDVRFAATLAFAGDVLGTLDCGLDMPARHDLEVIGSSGSLLLADPWHGRSASIELRRGDDVERVAVASANPYARELEDFAAAVRGEREHPFGRADAVGQALAIAALYRSAESERVAELVHRDPDADRRRVARDRRVQHHGDAAAAGPPDRRGQPEAAVAAAVREPHAVGDEHDVGAAAVARGEYPHVGAGAVPARGGRVDRRA